MTPFPADLPIWQLLMSVDDDNASSFHQIPKDSTIFHRFHQIPIFSTTFHQFPQDSITFHQNSQWEVMETRRSHKFPLFSTSSASFHLILLISTFSLVSTGFHKFPLFSTSFHFFRCQQVSRPPVSETTPHTSIVTRCIYQHNVTMSWALQHSIL